MGKGNQDIILINVLFKDIYILRYKFGVLYSNSIYFFAKFTYAFIEIFLRRMTI